MRIAVNGLYLIPGRVGGSETYLRETLAAMDRLAPPHAFTLFVSRDSADSWSALGGRFEVAALPVRAGAPWGRPARILAEQTLLPAALRRAGSEVLWNAGFTAPALAPCPQATTLYDLQHLERPEHFFAHHRLAWRAAVAASVRRSARLIAFSEATAEAIRARYGLPAGRVLHAPLGVSEFFFAAPPEAERRAARERLALSGDFFLCVSTTHPHKGHAMLLEAFARARPRLPEGARLVCVGPRGFAHEEIERAIARRGLEKDVRLAGWVSREDLRALYAEARAVLYPSTYEGFGLPVLEAMAAGAPVVASPAGEATAVGGGVARILDARDAGAWARAMVEAARDPEAARRARAEGPARARLYGWERTAEATLKAIEAAAAG